MINLLPPDNKRQIIAGQTNLLLLRYCIASVILAGLLFTMGGAFYIIMNNTKVTAERLIDESQLKTSNYAAVEQQAAAFKSNLSTTKTILDKEVHYSKVAVKIAQTLPSGITLQSLNLDAKTFGQPTVLNASGKSYDDALRLKSILEKSEVFRDVHLVSVSEGDGGRGVSIAISVVINPEVAKQ